MTVSGVKSQKSPEELGGRRLGEGRRLGSLVTIRLNPYPVQEAKEVLGDPSSPAYVTVLSFLVVRQAHRLLGTLSPSLLSALC